MKQNPEKEITIRNQLIDGLEREGKIKDQIIDGLNNEVRLKDEVIDDLMDEVSLKDELIQGQNKIIKTLEEHNTELKKLIEEMLTFQPK